MPHEPRAARIAKSTVPRDNRRRVAILVLSPLSFSSRRVAVVTPRRRPPTILPIPYTFTLTSAGVSPKELTVPLGTRVLFVNNDSRRHDMASDPHPEHDLCTEINSVGVLNPGRVARRIIWSSRRPADFTITTIRRRQRLPATSGRER